MYREVLLLRDVEGLSAAEVAEVLGVSVQAVKSRLHRARLSVRARVAPLLGIAPEAGTAPPGTCPDVLELVSRYLEGEISADVCAEMERHLAACGRCRATCESLKRTLALCRTSPPAPVPSAVQDSVRVAVRNFLARPS
jgi:RNA polymerase sigma-70 factor (ECF subfamily)